MTTQFQKLLILLKNSVFGWETTEDFTEDYDKILNLAVEQSVFPLAYSPISQRIAKQSPKWEALFLKTLAINERKQFCLKKVIEGFQAQGINYCVLKGCSIANTYYMPECRVSGDIDLLINPECEEKTMSMLEDMGIKVSPVQSELQHFSAYDSVGGLIEIHTKLYSEMFDKLVLKNKFSYQENFISVDTYSGFKVNTLSIEDNLNFLTAHLIKHFIKEGCGIRQITDLLAYINFYKDKIDMDKYFALLKEIRFDTFIKNILGIGVLYFDLDFEEYETDMVEQILSDIETGGNFGFNDEKRKGFYDNFLRIKSEVKTEEFNSLMEKKRRKEMLKSMFLPKRGSLVKKGYTYLEKYPVFYPVAYLHRIIDVFFLLIRKKRRLSALKYKVISNSTIDKRMELMKNIGIID